MNQIIAMFKQEKLKYKFFLRDISYLEIIIVKFYNQIIENIKLNLKHRWRTKFKRGYMN